jgi:hypothetical protein
MKWILHPAKFGAHKDLEGDTAHDRKEQGTDINSETEGCIGSHLSVFFCSTVSACVKSRGMFSMPGFIP